LEKIVANLLLVEPDSRRKQRHLASSLARKGDGFSRETIISRLKDIRSAALAESTSLKRQFVRHVSEHGYRTVFSAKDAADAVGHINQVMDGETVLAINKAGVIGELGTLLDVHGYRLLNTYLADFQNDEDPEVELDGYWQLPDVPTELAFETFTKFPLPQSEGRREYTALLGASAVAAEDGTICFLQHTSNVRTMLGEAQRLILIVPIDKIVQTREDALFQAKCMGTFGLESVLLDLELPDQPQEASELLDLELTSSPSESHIILLDNRRAEIMEDGNFADLLNCISCRGCAKHCPTHAHFNCELGNYPKQYLWSYLLGINQSLDKCIGCGMCYQECPLDIDIPHMIQVARNQTLSGFPFGLGHRLLQDAWPLMRAASITAPIANSALNNSSVRALIERWVGFQRDAWIPPAQKTTFIQWLRKKDRLKK